MAHQYASTGLSGGFVGLPFDSNKPLWIIDPTTANNDSHVEYLMDTTPTPLRGASASLVAFIVGYSRPPGVPEKDGNNVIGGGPLYLNFSAGPMVKPSMINSGWTQFYDFTTVCTCSCFLPFCLLMTRDLMSLPQFDTLSFLLFAPSTFLFTAHLHTVRQYVLHVCSC